MVFGLGTANLFAYDEIYQYYMGERQSEDPEEGSSRYVKRFQPQVFHIEEIRDLSFQSYLTVFRSCGMRVPIHFQERFLKEILRFPNLRFLGLANIGLRKFSRFFWRMVEAMPHLKVLDLSDNLSLQLSSEGLEALQKLWSEGSIHFILDQPLQEKMNFSGQSCGWVKRPIADVEFVDLCSKEAEEEIQKNIDRWNVGSLGDPFRKRNPSEKGSVRFSEAVQSATRDLEDHEIIPLKEWDLSIKKPIPLSHDRLLARLEKAQRGLSDLSNDQESFGSYVPEVYRERLKMAINNRNACEWALIKSVLAMPFLENLQKAYSATLASQNNTILKGQALVSQKALEDEIFLDVSQDTLIGDFRIISRYVFDGRRFLGEPSELIVKAEFYVKALDWELFKRAMGPGFSGYPWKDIIRDMRGNERKEVKRYLERWADYGPYPPESQKKIRFVCKALEETRELSLRL